MRELGSRPEYGPLPEPDPRVVSPSDEAVEPCTKTMPPPQPEPSVGLTAFEEQALECIECARDVVEAGAPSALIADEPDAEEEGARCPPRHPVRVLGAGGSERARLASARWLQNWWRRVMSMRRAAGRGGEPVRPGDWRLSGAPF